MGIGRYVGSCGDYMKYTLFIINSLLFVGGVAVMSVAIWMLVDKMHTVDIIGNEELYKGIVYVLCGAGAFVAFVSFLGCIGAMKEVKCLLGLYALIVFIIFVIMLVGGILGYVFREKVNDKIDEKMESSMKLYGQKDYVTDSWDWVQKEFECCGVNSHKDWPDMQKTFPDSCCSDGKQCSSNIGDRLYKEGCLKKTKEFIVDNATIIGGCGIGMACLTCLALIFSCCLIKMIGDD
ncbi:CD151 antigen isoform X2 [Anabrus simplex]